MKLSEEKKNNIWIYAIILLIILILIMSMSMIGITVLDSNSLNNITLQVNIT
jgi:hypothetical protein